MCYNNPSIREQHPKVPSLRRGLESIEFSCFDVDTISRPKPEEPWTAENVCRHCGRLPFIKKQGHTPLCKNCYGWPKIREQYRSGSAACEVRLKLAEKPCPHPPGSVEKIWEMIQRKMRGEYPHHPDDGSN
jgi:hypothetical protein